jgi:hypothetical protein
MRCTRSVLLVLLLLAGSLSPPAAHAQAARADPASERAPGFILEQNYPNPVNPETFIPFRLEESLFRNADTVRVTLRIYNILRQVVAIPDVLDFPQEGRRTPLIDQPFTRAGRATAHWDGRDAAGRRVPSGVYYYELVVNDMPLVRKMIVVNETRRRLIPWFGTGRRQ